MGPACPGGGGGVQLNPPINDCNAVIPKPYGEKIVLKYTCFYMLIQHILKIC